MPNLKYGIEVVGADKVKTALSSIDAQVERSARRAKELSREAQETASKWNQRTTEMAGGGGKGRGGKGRGGNVGQWFSRDGHSDGPGAVVSDSIRGIGTAAVTAISAAGALEFGAAIDEERRKKASVAELSYQFKGTEGTKGKGLKEIQAMTEAKVNSLATLTGRSADEIIEATRDINAVAGSFDATNALTGFVADISDATGSGLKDTAQATALAFDAFRRSGMSTADSIQSAQKAMLALAGAANVGTIEVRDLAPSLGELMASASGYSGSVEENAQRMIALANAIRPVSGSVDETVTALKRLPTNMAAHARDLEAKGVQIYEPGTNKTKLASPEKFIASYLQKVGTNKGDAVKYLGEEAAKVIDAFAPMFEKLGGKKKKGAGEQAVAMLTDPFKKAMMSREDLAENAADRRNQADRKFQSAMNELHAAVGEQLLPTLTKLVPEFTKLIPTITKAAGAFAEFVSWLADNPIKGIGAIVTGKIVADLAAAGLSAAASKAIDNIIQKLAGNIGGSGGPVPTPGGGGAGVGTAATMAVAALGIAAYNANEFMRENASDLSGASRESEREYLLSEAEKRGEKTAKREFSPSEKLLYGGESETIRRDASGDAVVDVEAKTDPRTAAYAAAKGLPGIEAARPTIQGTTSGDAMQNMAAGINAAFDKVKSDSVGLTSAASALKDAAAALSNAAPNRGATPTGGQVPGG